MGVYVCVIYMCLVRFSPQDFHIIPGGFCYLLGENLLLCLTPENFFKFDISPVGQAVPTGVVRQDVKKEVQFP